MPIIIPKNHAYSKKIKLKIKEIFEIDPTIH